MTEKAQQGFVDRWKAVLLRVAAIPFVFFGVGFYRAWLATFFRYDAFPTISVFDYFLFEGAIGIVSSGVGLRGAPCDAAMGEPQSGAGHGRVHGGRIGPHRVGMPAPCCPRR